MFSKKRDKSRVFGDVRKNVKFYEKKSQFFNFKIFYFCGAEVTAKPRKNTFHFENLRCHFAPHGEKWMFNYGTAILNVQL